MLAYNKTNPFPPLHPHIEPIFPLTVAMLQLKENWLYMRVKWGLITRSFQVELYSL